MDEIGERGVLKREIGDLHGDANVHHAWLAIVFCCSPVNNKRFSNFKSEPVELFLTSYGV